MLGESRRESESVLLLAGAGRLPREAAAAARPESGSLIAIAFEGITAPELESSVDEIHWLRLGALGALATTLEAACASRLLLVGKFSKASILDEGAFFEPDADAIRLLSEDSDRSDDGLLGVVATWLTDKGLELIDQREALSGLLVSEGVLGDWAPSPAALADCAMLALRGAEEWGAGDAQCVVVKERRVLEVEGDAGTDELIRRAGQPGATVIKRLRKNQDVRIDLPTIGSETLRAMSEVGADALAVQADATLVVDREGFRMLADELGIAVWGFQAEGAAS